MGRLPDSVKQKWDVPGGLGEPARKTIKGNNLDYYLNLLKETREKSLAEFRKRDDKWLMTVDKDWGWGPTNNYCKWFHVAEHESNHNGQIKLLKSRLPGAKSRANRDIRVSTVKLFSLAAAPWRHEENEIGSNEVKRSGEKTRAANEEEFDSRDAYVSIRSRISRRGGGSSELDLAVVVGLVFGDMKPLAIIVRRSQPSLCRRS